MTVLDLITSAMRSLTVLASGEVPTAEESNDALAIFNLMVDSWNTERLKIFTIPMQEFSITTNQQNYTLGPGGTLNMAVRPTRVERYGIVNLNNAAQPLELPLEMLTVDQWAAIPVKLIGSTLPTKIYDDGAYPLRNVSFWPFPLTAVNLRVYYWSPLAGAAILQTVLAQPPGYAEALKYNLAVRLAPEFGTSAPPDVQRLAMETKGKIKSVNAVLKDMRCDPALGRGEQYIYNWLSDGPITHGQ